MKQKIFCVVLLLITVMHFPAASKECAKVFKCPVVENPVKVQVKIPEEIKENAAAELSEEAALPASPFTRLFLNL